MARTGDARVPPRMLRPRITAYVLLAAAFALRIYHLDAQSLWFDEGFAIRVASQTVKGLIEQNPVGWLPLHSFVLHYWMSLFGTTPFSARLLSVYLGVLVVALLYPVSRRLGMPPDTGIPALSIAALSPFLIYYAQEARVYSLWLFLSLLSSYLLLRALRRPRRAWAWILYGVSTLAALYTHYFSVFLLPWGLAAIFYRAVRDRRRDIVLAGLGSQAGALVGCLPLIGFAQSSVGDRYGFWRSALSPSQVVADLWYHFSTGGNLSVGEALPLMLALGMMAAVGLVMLRPRWPGVLLALYLALPLTGMLILSRWRELYVSRYLALAAPAVYLVAAAGIGSLWMAVRQDRVWSRSLALAALAVVAAGTLPSWAKSLNNYYFSADYARDDFRSAALYISSHERDADALVMSGGGIYAAFTPYYGGDLPWVDLPRFGEWLEEDQVVTALNGLLADRPGGRVWLVLSGNEITDPQNLITAQLWTYGQVVEAQSFPGRTGVRVMLFEPRYPEGGFKFTPFSYRPLAANFDQQVELLGFEIDDSPFTPGEDIHLALRWRALRALTEDYHSFVHLLGPGDIVVAGQDKVPLNQYFRPAAWPVGEPLRDEYVLALPRDLIAGTYHVEVGLYSYPELERLPVVGGRTTERDRVLLTSIVVEE
jgi:4-amino-4-deoxy-L-arabinose transferase-like glycosyltransferase